jgi:hypothetical protein
MPGRRRKAGRPKGASGHGVARRVPDVAEPPELIDHRRPQRRGDVLGQDARVEVLGPEQCRREHEPEGPAVEALEQPTVTREECVEVSPSGLGHEVGEDDVLSRVEANRELLWKVPSGPGALLREHQRRQFVSGETVPLGEAGDLLTLGAQPGGLGVAVRFEAADFAVEHRRVGPPARERPRATSQFVVPRSTL